uniref:WWE domain-containing protein n=1 Tax=Panagrellus redivivus TaxID=6233 RepID=A0A7E4ZTI4_PANRE
MHCPCCSCPSPMMTEPPSPKASKVPIKQLPDDFKKKHTRSQSTMTDPAPINNHQTCPGTEKEVRDQLYITDNKSVYEWASKKTFIFRIFKLVYWAYRWSYDAFGLSPTWHSVMYVDDIVKDNKLIHVTDTLVLHIDTFSSFEKLIPFICGPFTRLTIHGGDIKLDQLKRLIRDTVRKVEITAQIELKRDEYDDAVRLITQHVRGFGYVFNLKSTPQLITKVKPVVESNRYFHAQNPSSDNCNVIHWTTHWLDMFMRGCQIGLPFFVAHWIAVTCNCKNTRQDSQLVQMPNHPNTLDSPCECDDSTAVFLFSTLFSFIVCFVPGRALGSKPD